MRPGFAPGIVNRMKTAAFRQPAIGGKMNNMASSQARPRLCALVRATAVALVVLSWTGIAFCGEIHDAARDGDVAKVTALLDGSPALVSEKDTNGATPLHMAAENGKKDVAALLLARGAKPSAIDNGGVTPLHMAAANGYKE